MFKVGPKDYIAALTIVFILALKLRGIDGSLDAILALIIGYYFGHRTTNVDNGN